MRKLLFWMHLAAGLAAGLIVLIMSVTGVLLMYEKQAIVWFDTRTLTVNPAAAAQRLPLETLLDRVRQTRGTLPSAIQIQSDAAKPVQLSFGTEVAYFDPYTATMLGEGSKGIRQFFRTVTDWHRWLAVSGENRPAARMVTGVANLIFLFLIVSGGFLWLPRVWTKTSVRAVAFFKGGLSGKARDFNWHNVVGVWSLVPLFFIVLGATVISFPWASNLVYVAAGSPIPAPNGEKGGGRGPQAESGRKTETGPRGASSRGERKAAPDRTTEAASPNNLDLAGINNLWSQASNHAGEWRAITMRLPQSDKASITFLIDGGYGGQPQKRTTLTLSRTGTVENSETFQALNRGRRIRTWLRFVHTGEYYGLTGQTIAGLASAGAVVLVYTGFALSLRRFAGWRSRRSRRNQLRDNSVKVSS